MPKKKSENTHSISIFDHNCEPININKVDMYNYRGFVERLSSTLTKCKTPLTAAIYGRWGKGKSSVLLTLKENFEPLGYKVFEYNPWNYDLNSFEEVWESLLASLELQNKVLKGLLGAVGVAAQTQGSTKKDVTDVFSPSITKFQNARKSFNEKIKTEIEKRDSKDRVFILIDDLDRCEPVITVNVLRAVQIFCSIPGVVVIFGMDREVIVSNIHELYNDSEYAREYLEKMIKLPLYLPSVSLSEIKDWLLENNSAFMEVFTSNDILEFILSSLDNNPRKLERFFSLFNFWRGKIQSLYSAQLKGSNLPTYGRFNYVRTLYILLIICLIQINETTIFSYILKYGGKFIYAILDICKKSGLTQLLEIDDIEDITEFGNVELESWQTRLTSFMVREYPDLPELIQLSGRLDFFKFIWDFFYSAGRNAYISLSDVIDSINLVID